MRLSQWTKNAFVFAPAFFSRNFFEAELILQAAGGALAFCFASSAAYLFNDTLDREADWAHPRKRRRPIASGEVSVKTAVIAAVALTAASVLTAGYLSATFLGIITLYLVLNILYSTSLKHVVIVDVFCISLGFLLRVTGGSELVGVTSSHWLVLCTVTLSAFLGFSKRRQELVAAGDDPAANRAVLRSYSVGFLDQLIAVATSCAIVTYALYTVADQTVARFGTTDLVYTFPLVVFGIFRYLFLVYHCNGEDNPSALVFSDKALVIDCVLFALVAGLIIY